MDITTSVGNFKKADSFVAVDVLRASATICYGLKGGVKSFRLVKDLGSALSTPKGKYLRIGEKHGMKVRGLDIANSPREITERNVKGREAVFYSDNLARVLNSYGGGKTVFIGTFCNAKALAKVLKSYGSVNFVACTYRRLGPLFFWEDLIGIGKIIHELSKLERLELDRLSSFCLNAYRRLGRAALLLCPNVYYTALIAGVREIELATEENNIDIVPACISKEGGIMVKPSNMK